MSQDRIQDISNATGIPQERLQEIRNGQDPTGDEVLQLFHGFFGIESEDGSKSTM